MAYRSTPVYSGAHNLPSRMYSSSHSELERIVTYQARTFSYNSGYSQLPSYGFSPFSAPVYAFSSPFESSYKRKDYYTGQKPETTTTMTHETFLSPSRSRTQFIDNAQAIRQYVEAAFKLTTGEEMPRDFTIEVLPEKEFRKIRPEHGVLGFAVNRKHFGKSNIVVMENELDMMMIVIGHEIGHVLTLSAKNIQDEEAKAFAFQFAWTKILFEHNIAGLRKSINEDIFQPAHNGIHDVAFSFVQKLTAAGRSALEVYGLIATGLVGIHNWQLLDF